MAFVKTKVEELPESRVRLDVEVPEEDVAHAFEHAASDMAESLRVPYDPRRIEFLVLSARQALKIAGVPSR